MQAYEKLEQEWAEFSQLDPQGMVACSSGTAALHLALEAMQLPQGSEVVTSDFNMIAVPRAIAMAGLKPRFVDCDERLLMRVDLAADVVERYFFRDHTGCCAVLAAHIYGRQIDMDMLVRLVGRQAPGFPLIEDLAEAHGVRPNWRTDAACWSFYKNKIVAGEEGGAVWFRDPKHAALARQLRCLGFTDAHDFNHVPRGHNYRLANCLAEKVLESLAGYEDNVGRRRYVESEFDKHCPPEWRMPERQAPWVYDFRIPGLTRQDTIVTGLREDGARHAFKPMSEQPEFRGTPGPNAKRASTEVVYLPLTLPRRNPQRIFEQIKSLL